MSQQTDRVAVVTPFSTLPSADVLSALIALNQHARAYGSGKEAIYAYKTLVAGMLVAEQQAIAQLVQWTGKCGHCIGSGRYVDSYGQHFPWCRRCSSTGTVTLKFVETTLSNGTVWHHPFDMSSGWDVAKLAGLAIYDGNRGGWKDAKGNEPVFWNVGTDWRPNLPAEKLIADDAAMYLNAVEAWVLRLAFPYHPVGWNEPTPNANTLHFMQSRAVREMRGYYLDLGRIGLNCWYCQSPEIKLGLHREGPPFSWSAPVCPMHSEVTLEQWPARHAVPEWVITPPLAEWKERHQRLGWEIERSWD